ncbi:Bcr/CflA family efflux MFS transporter [Parvibaculum sedimenti]|uniref:Bcr/CflA family efflux transporter n=1 Tax=Parvibaculum sedimenti TaxID=2608632 RepID=A0A6N6VFJ2_9HYPH|nr:multidrug effflux MFS transporter [Parvibaculum sedimenti]KAB7738644.1 Bcr/CflA family efflux MFS transporter [Parvibaculum sedimenti]
MAVRRFDTDHLKFVVILGALTAFAPLSIDMYLPAFPAIAAHFHASAGEVQATLAIYFVGLALGQSVLGPLSDRTGRLPPMLLGIGAFVLGAIWAAQAPNIESLVAARFVQALGGCAGIVVSRAMVRDLFDERASAQVFSMLMLVMGLAPILAPMIGGFLIAHYHWPVIFWCLAGFGLACLIAVWLGLGETLPREKRSHGGLGHVLRAYIGLFADGPFMAFSLANACISAAMFAYITGSPFVFITLHGLSPEHYAMAFGLNAFGLITASQVNAFLLRRVSGRTILNASMSAHLAAALALLGASIFMPQSLAVLMVCLFILIGSLGFIGANATAAAMARAGERIGAAAALTGIIQFALAAGAGALVGALNDGTAMPMALAIAGLSLAGTTARLFAR